MEGVFGENTREETGGEGRGYLYPLQVNQSCSRRVKVRGSERKGRE